MANLNKVILIGRLTRDPETRSFPSGGMVAKFGFAVTNRRKNTQTGQWEDEPMFIDVEVFNRGEGGKQADLVRDRCRKGSQVMLEAKLHLDQWDDKNGGGKRSKHKLIADNIQLLDPRQDGGGGGGDYSGGAAEGFTGGGGNAGGGNRGVTNGGGRPAPVPAPTRGGGRSSAPPDDGDDDHGGNSGGRNAGGGDDDIPF